MPADSWVSVLALVARVPGAVPVRVGLLDVAVRGAVVAVISDTVFVSVLVAVRRQEEAEITVVSEAVFVAVFLSGVARGGAAVTLVADTIEVAV